MLLEWTEKRKTQRAVVNEYIRSGNVYVERLGDNKHWQ